MHAPSQTQAATAACHAATCAAHAAAKATAGPGIGTGLFGALLLWVAVMAVIALAKALLR